MRFFLPLLLMLFSAITSMAQGFQVDTIQYVGDSEEFYDLIIVAEGYTESDLSTFRSDAHKVRDIMMLNNAYLAVMDKMNIFSISTPSKDAGISLRTEFPSPSDPIQTPDIKDTYFGIFFLNSFRAYFMRDSTIIEARRVAGEHIPFSDVVLIMTNDTIVSGRASYNGVATATRPGRSDYPLWEEYVINHELAHSIAGLSDAYSTTKEEGFNKSTNKDPNTLRWKDFLSSDEVGIDSITEGVYIPNVECMMIAAQADYLCPVCNNRVHESVANISQRLPTPHRMWFLGQDDENNTQTFGWDAIPGATHYEVVFHAYLQREVVFGTTETNQISFTLEEDMMAQNYVRSISIRAYNGEASTQFARYNVISFIADATQPADVPIITNITKTTETSYRIDFEQEVNTEATVIRIYNQAGIFSEILTDQKSIELSGLKADESYQIQLAAVYPYELYDGNSSAFSALIPLQGSTDCQDNPVSILQEDNNLKASIDGATYQWIDCQTDKQVLEGETAQVFTPTSDGSYAVIVTSGTCVNTSDCIDVFTTRTFDRAFAQEIMLAPNPAKEQITLQFNQLHRDLRIELVNLQGQSLLDRQFSRTDQIRLNISNIDPGLYFIRIQTGDRATALKLMKE